MAAKKAGFPMTKEQFTTKILALEKSMYHTAIAVLKNDDDCADAMQNAIMLAYKNLPSLKKPEFFNTWLTRILLNECYKIIRSRRNTVEYEDYLEPAQDAGSGSLESSELFGEIMQLGESYRVPIVLHYIEGYSVKETAAMLGATPAAVKQRLLRARKILKERFGERL